MLIEPMIQQLNQLRLHGMAAGLEQLLRIPNHHALSFEERLSAMIQHEVTERKKIDVDDPRAVANCRTTARGRPA